MTDLEHAFEVVAEPDDTPRYRVKTVGGVHVELIPMMFNWRIHTVRVDEGPMAWSERYWCYEGRTQATFVRAVLAAHAWDGADDTEPVGWIKSWDGRRHGARPGATGREPAATPSPRHA
jgi:hypothetical protein